LAAQVGFAPRASAKRPGDNLPAGKLDGPDAQRQRLPEALRFIERADLN
jgi:hypothetical protein